MKLRVRSFILKLSVAGMLLAQAAQAQSVYTSSTTADIANAFVTDGSTNNASPNDNYGAAGALMVAGTNGTNGPFLSLVEFNLSGAVTQFNAEYGVGNWTITGVSITLAGNAATPGGNAGNAIFPTITAGGFDITWMQNDTWTQGTGTPGSPEVPGAGSTDVTYNNLLSTFETPGTDELLGSYTYTPPGNNVALTWNLGTGPSDSGFVEDIENSTPVSLLFSPTSSTMAYLFNSRSYTNGNNRPIMTVTAVPEPASSILLLGGLGGYAFFCRRRV
jgi:hypothetical protein